MFCNKCGSQVGDGAKFCPKCGAEFQFVETRTQKTCRVSKKKYMLIGCICIVVLGIGVVTVFGLGKRDETSGEAADNEMEMLDTELEIEEEIRVTVDNIRYVCYEDGMTAEVGYRQDVSGKIIIPATIEVGSSTYQVTAIGEQAFLECDGLKSITLPTGLRVIKSCAFQGCDELTDIVVPDGVTVIESDAFYGCDKLTNVELPETLTTIEDHAFYNCCNLLITELPPGLESIGEKAFWNCKSLTRETSPEGLELPSGLESCGECSLPSTGYGVSIKIPKSVIDKIPNIEELSSYGYNLEIIDTPTAETRDTDDYDRSDFESDRAYQEYSDFGDTSGLRK